MSLHCYATLVPATNFNHPKMSVTLVIFVTDRIEARCSDSFVKVAFECKRGPQLPEIPRKDPRDRVHTQ